MQAVGGGESFVAVGTLHEFVAESGAPLGCVGRGLRDGFQSEAARVVASNFDGESIVEAERRAHGEVEALGIFSFYLIVDFFMVGAGLFLQYRRESGAGVFRIDIDAACENGLVADVSTGEIEAALDLKMSFGFDLLGDHFSEDQLLGEIFGANDYAMFAGGAASGERGNEDDCADSLNHVCQDVCHSEGREESV